MRSKLVEGDRMRINILELMPTGSGGVMREGAHWGRKGLRERKMWKPGVILLDKVWREGQRTEKHDGTKTTLKRLSACRGRGRRINSYGRKFKFCKKTRASDGLLCRV